MRAKVKYEEVLTFFRKMRERDGVKYFDNFNMQHLLDLSQKDTRVGMFQGNVNKYRKGYRFYFYPSGRSATHYVRLVWHVK